jgi:predicted ATPase
MITRIEIDGFKSFHNFTIDLKPFQVLIGSNGVGKSNLSESRKGVKRTQGQQEVAERRVRQRGRVACENGQNATAME